MFKKLFLVCVLLTLSKCSAANQVDNDAKDGKRNLSRIAFRPNPDNGPSPTPDPTRSPTRAPRTNRPTREPTRSPTRAPTRAPRTDPPTREPTRAPRTDPPTREPTRAPRTNSPTRQPTRAPDTDRPTRQPTRAPDTDRPTRQPTRAPDTDRPTRQPTRAPLTNWPTRAPTVPAWWNTQPPTESPTKQPTASPTKEPTSTPTKEPTEAPSASPSVSPTDEPSAAPSESPSSAPTRPPTLFPIQLVGAENVIMELTDVKELSEEAQGNWTEVTTVHLTNEVMSAVANTNVIVNVTFVSQQKSLARIKQGELRRMLKTHRQQITFHVSYSVQTPREVTSVDSYVLGAFASQFKRTMYLDRLKEYGGPEFVNVSDVAVAMDLETIPNKPPTDDTETPGTPDDSTSSEGNDGSPSTGRVIGVVIACLVVVIIGVAFWFRLRKQGHEAVTAVKLSGRDVLKGKKSGKYDGKQEVSSDISSTDDDTMFRFEPGKETKAKEVSHDDGLSGYSLTSSSDGSGGDEGIKVDSKGSSQFAALKRFSSIWNRSNPTDAKKEDKKEDHEDESSDDGVGKSFSASIWGGLKTAVQSASAKKEETQDEENGDGSNSVLDGDSPSIQSSAVSFVESTVTAKEEDSGDATKSTSVSVWGTLSPSIQSDSKTEKKEENGKSASKTEQDEENGESVPETANAKEEDNGNVGKNPSKSRWGSLRHSKRDIAEKEETKEEIPKEYTTVKVEKGVKLGLLVETSDEGAGPVVKGVKPQSPFEGKVKEGDLLISVNDQDVTTATSEMVSRVIAIASKNGPNTRVFVFERAIPEEK